ncbi:hypothetical protein G7K_6883-t1 [Saitoella complicata NRRL Y-17804]|uniref:Uncharacterized protein n=1 Tax=Saitoella complicata (strain BCRC 22490 / CBS 7301 / JCM 7358 / NBRC 10748 / NRRL Y-17804) TaxID=698492 RepID=A0A0E9NT06_SAICN|nr:hypothetical protein G7K_6883-t1 [Saitoella complicata NRRL Y-17804]
MFRGWYDKYCDEDVTGALKDSSGFDRVAIKNKHTTLNAAFGKADAIACATGGGDRGNGITLKEKILKVRPFYDELVVFFKDKHNMRPPVLLDKDKGLVQSTYPDEFIEDVEEVDMHPNDNTGHHQTPAFTLINVDDGATDEHEETNLLVAHPSAAACAVHKSL